MRDWQIELTCSVCGQAEALDAPGAARRLLGAGLLRSHSEATNEELRELFLALAGKLPCSGCGRVGLKARLLEDEAEGWLEARRCEDCGKPINAERLEVFPDAKLCPTCQQRAEKGAAPSTGQFCPTCGSPMMVRPSSGRGVHRYVLACSKSPPCRGRAT
ncbi:MAG TPA: TraR/DksA C4-type zinc finger protein [Pirellulales bacterium]|nr:TraR/DksA C4-type zinc finger protein [Pirellulales bacterium]